MLGDIGGKQVKDIGGDDRSWEGIGGKRGGKRQVLEVRRKGMVFEEKGGILGERNRLFEGRRERRVLKERREERKEGTGLR